MISIFNCYMYMSRMKSTYQTQIKYFKRQFFITVALDKKRGAILWSIQKEDI